MTKDDKSKPKNGKCSSGNGNSNSEDPLDVLRNLQTGDLLLYKTRDYGAFFNSLVGGSFYSHVSLVVKADPRTLETMYTDDYKNSDPLQEGLAIFEAEPNRGVAVFPLVARLARTIRNVKHLHVRRHVGTIEEDHHAALMEFMNTVLGRKLEVLSADMARALLFNRCNYCLVQRKKSEDWDEFWCSELVAEALMQLKIIRCDEKVKSNLFNPSSFQDPQKRDLRHSGAFDFLDKEKVCLEGHHFGSAQVLIAPRNELTRALKNHKKRMLEEKRRKEQQRNLKERISQITSMAFFHSSRTTKHASSERPPKTTKSAEKDEDPTQ